MINILKKAMQELPELFETVDWQTLDITYEPPHVERVWCQWEDYRIYLHRIYACDEGAALWHPHPWPSAIYIASGHYEMGVANEVDEHSGIILPNESKLAAKLILPAGTYYEMNSRSGWHYVRPLETVMSIMITGKPWLPIIQPGKEKHKPEPLANNKKDEILKYFREHICRMN